MKVNKLLSVPLLQFYLLDVTAYKLKISFTQKQIPLSFSTINSDSQEKFI